MLLDTTHTIATPEGVELNLPLAGLAPRALAWIIDTFIKLVVYSLVAGILSATGAIGWAVILLLAFVLLWFYDVLLEVFNHGATPGKMALGLKVVNIDGTPIGWGPSLVRNLIRFVDSLPGVFLVGLIAVLTTSRFQRLGDLAANTIVIHSGRDSAGQRDDDIKAIPVKFPLTAAEQQAVVSFAERGRQISEDRAEELAALLKPVFGDIDAAKLRGHAHWVAGGDQKA